jgi:ankyrin repeat protein
VEMMKLLLARGADPGLRGPRGANALSIAKQSGRGDLLKLLESHGNKP